MGMFCNENDLTFGGTIGKVTKTANGCLKFGICNDYVTTHEGNLVNSPNWLNVLLTENQSKSFSGKINKGDEITVRGNLRITTYDNAPSVTLFVKKIEKIQPSEQRVLGSLYYSFKDKPERVLLKERDLLKSLIEQTYANLVASSGGGSTATTNQLQAVAQAPVQQPVVDQPQVAAQTPAQQPVVDQVQVVTQAPAPQQVATQPQAVAQAPAPQQVVTQPQANSQFTNTQTQSVSISPEVLSAAIKNSSNPEVKEEPDWVSDGVNPEDVLRKVANTVATNATGQQNHFYNEG